jgi:integrase
MMKVKFTDRTVLNLKAKESRYDVREDSAHGNGTLGMRVSPNGHKAWQFYYTVNGRNRRMTLGAYPTMSVAQAHSAGAEAMQKLDAGVDPASLLVAARLEERKAPTFLELSKLYMKEWSIPNKKSADRDQAALDRDVLPMFGPHKAESIERRDVRALLNAIVERGAPIQANRTLALVRKIYNWAMGQDIVKLNPCDRLPAPGKESKRTRKLSEDELKSFLKALPGVPITDNSKLVLQFMLITGQRCGEVLGLRWDEIEEDAGWWTIPEEKSKNNLPHRVPLSPQAKAILTQARALHPDNKTVFASPRGDQPMCETAMSLAVRRNLLAFGALKPFTPHDLRRTGASNWASAGVPRTVIAMILNHVDPDVTSVYDRHSYDPEKRKALTEWGEQLEALWTT